MYRRGGLEHDPGIFDYDFLLLVYVYIYIYINIIAQRLQQTELLEEVEVHARGLFSASNRDKLANISYIFFAVTFTVFRIPRRVVISVIVREHRSVYTSRKR